MKADATRPGRWHDVPVNLLPLTITRIANVLGSVALVVLGVLLWLQNGVRPALLLSVLGAWLAVRVYWIGVNADEQTVRVKGLLWSRTIPIDRIKRITTYPASQLDRTLRPNPLDPDLRLRRIRPSNPPRPGSQHPHHRATTGVGRAQLTSSQVFWRSRLAWYMALSAVRRSSSRSVA